MTTLRRSLKRVPLHVEVAEIIRGMIIEGSLPEGEHIKELELCEQLEVSRTPLREALKVLANEGLVVTEANRGTWVSVISGDEYFDIFEIIGALERKAAERLCEVASDEEIAHLVSLQTQMEGEFKRKNKEAYFALNQTIHKYIIEKSGNQRLAVLHGQLNNLSARGRYRAIDSTNRWAQSISEHRQLTDAIAQRDSAQAGLILEKHVMHTGHIIKKMLAQ